MSPEDRTLGFDDGDVVVPFGDGPLGGELAALDHELRAAGDRLRRAHARDGRGRPSAAFAASLRTRLLAAAAADSVAGAGKPQAVPAGAGSRTRADAAALAPDGTLVPVRPRLALRIPAVLPSPRWSALAVAAMLVASVLGVNAERWFAAPAPARVTDAVGAVVVRDGERIAIVPGTPLVAGDAIEVDAEGGASAQLDGSVVRIAGGGRLRIDDLVDGIALTQLAGRAWHRVVAPAGEPYVVATGDLRWTARGTAFDLAFEPDATLTQVRLRALEHAVDLHGPGLELRVAEGREAVVRLGSAAPEVAVGDLPAAAARDPWLLANARLDAAAGLGVGWLTTALADDALATPTPLPSSLEPSPSDGTATAAPAVEPPSGEPAPAITPAPAATPRPTATPKPRATPKPTAKPAPTATPKPTSPPVATLEMDAIACAGTAVLDWTGTASDAFDHWTVLRAPEPFAVPKTYPPAAPVTGLEGSWTTDPSKTAYADPGLGSGTSAWYRAVAWDGSDRAIAASDDVKLTGSGVASLGTFEATPVAGGFDAAWSAFDGSGACFTYYKISWSATSTNPSYLGDHDGAQAVDGASTASASVALGPGAWHARIEAIAVLAGKKILVARSSVADVTIEP